MLTCFFRIALVVMISAYSLKGQGCTKVSMRIYALEPYSLYQAEITPDLFFNEIVEPVFYLSIKNVNYIDTLYEKMFNSEAAVLDNRVQYEAFEGRLLVSFYCGNELIDYMFFNPEGSFIRMNRDVVYMKDDDIVLFLKSQFGLRYFIR